MQAGAGTIEAVDIRASRGWINLASCMDGCERIEAFFSGQAYEPHRHDTYAIGRTISGVQQFRYRGQLSAGLSDTVMVLHPDELHDGQAGTEDGFHYRMIYLDPSLVQKALGDGEAHALPFISEGISRDPRLLRAVDSIVANMSEPMEGLQYDDAVYDVAHALQAAGQQSTRRKIARYDYQAAECAREYLLDAGEQTVSLEQLEAIAQRDRWKLSRDFRALFGTSPYRYLVMRRLDRAKAAIISGQSLAQAALEAGFADQAHFTRHFRKSFGLTPARWQRFIRQR